MVSPPTLDGLLAWLDAAPNRERTGNFAGLHTQAMARVLAHLPTPPSPVTIAGTKGKGSTLHLIEAGLAALGRTTMAFTSPHVRSVAERWRLDGREATPEDLQNAQATATAAEMAAGCPLSWFERSLALAVILASRRPSAVFLAEVGIGGRQDAVNALDAGIAVVTHLSHDHRDVLGPTLDHIAHQKLGIARGGHPLVIAPQSPEAAAAIGRRLSAGDADGAQIIAVTRGPALDLGLPGDHQQDNAATALAVLTLLAPGTDLGPVKAAWRDLHLPARCQRIHHRGRSLLVDGAHNGPSIAATLQVAHQDFPQGFTLLLALARDKEVEEILATLPAGLAVVRCGYASPRARQEADWPPEARGWPWYETVAEALAAVPGPLCITGSFYLAAEALATLESP